METTTSSTCSEDHQIVDSTTTTTTNHEKTVVVPESTNNNRKDPSIYNNNDDEGIGEGTGVVGTSFDWNESFTNDDEYDHQHHHSISSITEQQQNHQRQEVEITTSNQLDQQKQQQRNQNQDQDHSNDNDNHENDNENGLTVPPVYKFVLTGGPCGGKTTSLARVFSFLRERNFEVINVPEAYTILSSNGLSTDLFTTPGMDIIIQSAVLDCQLTYEKSIETVLHKRVRDTKKPAVMLCDRGLMDGSVFVSSNDFLNILQSRNISSIVEARDHRYDAVFHLVTAADGAEAYYTLDNNIVRWESIDEAKINDQLIQKAWIGHPHYYVIDNHHTDFEGKMNRLINIISKIVGLPSNLQRRSIRYLLIPPPPIQQQPESNVEKMEDKTKTKKKRLSTYDRIISSFPLDIKYQVFDVEKVYLLHVPQQSKQQQASSGTEAETVQSTNHTIQPTMNTKAFLPKEDSSDDLPQQKDNGGGDIHPMIPENQPGICMEDGSYSFIRRRTNIQLETNQPMGSVYQITTVKKYGVNQNHNQYNEQQTATEIDNDDNDDTDTTSSSTKKDPTIPKKKNDIGYEIVEQKRIISRREYEAYYLNSRDTNRYIIQQRRIAFLYSKQSFTIHMYREPKHCRNLCILHAQVEKSSSSSSSTGTSTSSSTVMNDQQQEQHPTTTTAPTITTTTTTPPPPPTNQLNNSSSMVELPPFLHIERQLNSNEEDDEKYGAYSLSIIR